MSNIEWKYVSPLKKGTEIDDLEIKYNFTLPADLKDCLRINNAGTPSGRFFDMEDEEEIVFGGFISFNEDDLDNIYDFIALFENSDKNRLEMFPFGIDTSGNLFCVKENKIVFYDQEVEESVGICNTFTDFLAMLYERE